MINIQEIFSDEEMLIMPISGIKFFSGTMDSKHLRDQVAFAKGMNNFGMPNWKV